MDDLPDGFPTMESFLKLQKQLPNIWAYLVSAIFYVYTFLCNQPELLYPTVFKYLEIKFDSIYCSLACFHFLETEARARVTTQDMSLFRQFFKTWHVYICPTSLVFGGPWAFHHHRSVHRSEVSFQCRKDDIPLHLQWNIFTPEWEIKYHPPFLQFFVSWSR